MKKGGNISRTGLEIESRIFYLLDYNSTKAKLFKLYILIQYLLFIFLLIVLIIKMVILPDSPIF